MPTVRNPRHGRIWFLTSDLLEKHYKFFLKCNKNWLHYMEEDYDLLFNYIIAENKISIKWLKWQGFIFSKQNKLVKNVKIMYFYKRLHNVTKYGTQPILDEIGPSWTTKLI
tara:strand:- start:5307 stop:5639 length:333 start_codon:yes stop_codon:yes gene_type:complete